MKQYPSLKWRDLDNYSTSQTSINYSVAYQNEDTIAPVITSPNTLSIEENIGSEQVVYTTTALDNLDVANFSYEISGTDAFEFTIDPSTGEVSLIENPDFETKNSFTFELTATDVFGNTSIPFPVNLIITDEDEEPPVITSGRKTRDVVSYDFRINPLIYTIEATDNVAVYKYFFAGDEIYAGSNYPVAILNENNDYVFLEINTITGNILFGGASNYSNLPATYSFDVTAIDEKRNISDSLMVSLTIRDIQRTIGETRYIMFRGTDDNGEFNNIGELDIFDFDGNNLIGNGTLNTNNFTYRYGGGYFKSSSSSNSIGDASITLSQSGSNLFDYSVSSPYANNLFSESLGEKWVLIDLGQTVEVGKLTIQARSNSTNHINRINHLTVFTSDRNDTGFSYTGSASGDENEDLTLGRTINEMKSDTTLKWFDLDVFNSQATTRNFIEPSIGIEPTITSSNSADNVLENSGTGQLVYTAETSNDNGTVNFSIYGIAVNEFTINPNTGEVFLIENPDFETKNAYTFRVIATDNHGNTSTPHQVSFSIIDIDEEAP
ncbi:MAG: cadherin repeat domain-containing protein, partial [Flavobacteriales bacterium]|nr:cadherin repeat domain-containing protein [Flavobacteriales bacterium]